MGKHLSLIGFPHTSNVSEIFNRQIIGEKYETRRIYMSGYIFIRVMFIPETNVHKDTFYNVCKMRHIN